MAKTTVSRNMLVMVTIEQTIRDEGLPLTKLKKTLNFKFGATHATIHFPHKTQGVASYTAY